MTEIGSPLGFGTAAGPAPELGQDTEAVLRQAGYTIEELRGLRARGVVGRGE